MRNLSRHEIENISIGQTGLYHWNKEYPVVEVGELRSVLFGPGSGDVFRYIQVGTPSGAKIGFTVSEERQ